MSNSIVIKATAGFQELWCCKDGIRTNSCVTILIPTVCPSCSQQLIMSDIGNLYHSGTFKSLCEHFSTYEKIWKNRVSMGYGAHCTSKRSTKCMEFNPDAENKPDFVCFACRSGW